jgi:hypothetical protein
VRACVAVALVGLINDIYQQIHLAKLPNFLNIDPRPFDPQTYEDDANIDEDEDDDDSKHIKLKVENTLRWRYAKTASGQEVRGLFFHFTPACMPLKQGFPCLAPLDGSKGIKRAFCAMVRWHSLPHAGERVF